MAVQWFASPPAFPGNHNGPQVNNWRLVWEASKVEKQQQQAVQELTGKLRRSWCRRDGEHQLHRLSPTPSRSMLLTMIDHYFHHSYAISKTVIVFTMVNNI